ncbi:MAG: glycosyltransferase [Actinobacteria bacterium]|nr:glycosyltransferase [Actinomycetota bacterium]
MPDWTIVVPMFAESGRIGATVATLSASELAARCEFVFVDDGSPDDTVAVLRAALDGSGLLARVVRLPRNLGKGAAVRTGVLAATAPVVAFVDADLSSPPSAIAEVCRAVEAGAQVAVASRAHPESDLTVRQPRGREGAGKTFNRLLRALRLTALPDTQCGLKAFDRASAISLFGSLSIRRFAFDVEVLLRAERLGLRIVVIPTEWAHVEASRVSPLRDGGRMALDALRLAIVTRRDAVASDPGPAATTLAGAESVFLQRRLRGHAGQHAAVLGGAAEAVRERVAAAGLTVAADPAARVDAAYALGVRLLASDVTVLRSAAERLAPGGRLILSTRRRRGMTRADLEQLLSATGFDVEQVSHAVNWLPRHDGGRILLLASAVRREEFAA